MASDAVSRRSVISGLVVTAAAGVAGYFVAQNSSVAKAKASTGYSAGAQTGGRLLASVDQVPVKGGVVLAGQQVVLTRDPGGTVHGFSAICTHQGCTVDSVQNGTIMCPCHGSRFNADTGAVTEGPATRPLPAVPVTVRGTGIYTS